LEKHEAVLETSLAKGKRDLRSESVARLPEVRRS
jgi:hypothetical protein